MDRSQVQASRSALVILNSDVRERWHGPQHVTLDPQLRSLLQWVAASMADIPQIQLSPDRELQQVRLFLPGPRPRWSEELSPHASWWVGVCVTGGGRVLY